MLDIHWLRNNIREAKRRLFKRGEEPVKLLTEFVKVDNNWRQDSAALQTLLEEKNKLSKTKPSLAGIARSRELNHLIEKATTTEHASRSNLEKIAFDLPNLPYESPLETLEENLKDRQRIIQELLDNLKDHPSDDPYKEVDLLMEHNDIGLDLLQLFILKSETVLSVFHPESTI